MTMSVIWTAMAVLSVLCGLATGRGEQVAAAAVEAAQYFQLGARLHLDTVPVIRVILGSVFDWMDILCYAVGAGLCALWQAAEPRILSRKTG